MLSSLQKPSYIGLDIPKNLTIMPRTLKKKPFETNIVFIDNLPDFEVSYLTTKIRDLIPLFHHIPGQ